MFEHMKNYQLLTRKIAGWLKPGGKLFVHIFTHATTPYHFKDGWVGWGWKWVFDVIDAGSFH